MDKMASGTCPFAGFSYVLLEEVIKRTWPWLTCELDSGNWSSLPPSLSLEYGFRLPFWLPKAAQGHDLKIVMW